MSSEGVRVSVLVNIDVQCVPLAKPAYEVGQVISGAERSEARVVIGRGSTVFVEGGCLEDIAGWFAASAEAIFRRAREIEREAGR